MIRVVGTSLHHNKGVFLHCHCHLFVLWNGLSVSESQKAKCNFQLVVFFAPFVWAQWVETTPMFDGRLLQCHSFSDECFRSPFLLCRGLYKDYLQRVLGMMFFLFTCFLRCLRGTYNNLECQLNVRPPLCLIFGVITFWNVIQIPNLKWTFDMHPGWRLITVDLGVFNFHATKLNQTAPGTGVFIRQDSDA